MESGKNFLQGTLLIVSLNYYNSLAGGGGPMRLTITACHLLKYC